jgi:hypothetical protein
MSEFKLPLGPRDQGWIILREQLACVARELHFVATSIDAVNSTVLLMAARNFATLAMSIPMCPAQATFGQLVDSSTLLAAQVLGRDSHPTGDAAVIIGDECEIRETAHGPTGLLRGPRQLSTGTIPASITVSQS